MNKRHAEGGGVREGRNENIDDDTRARAMEAVRRRMAGEEDSDSAPASKAASKPAPKAAPKPAPKAAAPSPSPSPAPASASPPLKHLITNEMRETRTGGESDDMRERSGGNPRVAALRKYGPGAALAAASIYPATRLIGTALKGLRGAGTSAFSKVAQSEAKLATGNATLRERMAGITANAEKEAASQAAKRDMFKASQERLKSGSGKAAEERLTGLAMNPRRKNIALTEAEKAAQKAAEKAAAKAAVKKTPGTGKPIAASKAKRDTKFNRDEDGVEFRRGGGVKKMASGGSVSSRADGCAQRGKTNCRIT